MKRTITKYSEIKEGVNSKMPFVQSFVSALIGRDRRGRIQLEFIEGDMYELDCVIPREDGTYAATLNGSVSKGPDSVDVEGPESMRFRLSDLEFADAGKIKKGVDDILKNN